MVACLTDGRGQRGDAAFLCPAQPFQLSQTSQKYSTDPAPPLKDESRVPAQPQSHGTVLSWVCVGPSSTVAL